MRAVVACIALSTACYSHHSITVAPREKPCIEKCRAQGGGQIPVLTCAQSCPGAVILSTRCDHDDRCVEAAYFDLTFTVLMSAAALVSASLIYMLATL